MSDQDFFFDDEDEQPSKDSKPEKTKTTKTAPAKKATRPAPSSSAASFWQQTVTTAVTGLVALIFMLLGVIVGIVLPVGGVTSDVPAPGSTAGAAAPALTEEQLSSGQMPEGHPPLGDMPADPGAVATDTGEATTTP